MGTYECIFSSKGFQLLLILKSDLYSKAGYLEFYKSFTITCLPYCLKLWPRHWFFPVTFHPGHWIRLATTQDQCLSLEVLNQSPLIDAGIACVADQLDNMHHKIDSKVHSHHVYKSVWSPVVEQLCLEKEPVANPHD